MNKPLLLSLSLAALVQGLPASTQAVDVDLSIRTPGMSLYIGDRDRDGRYWDGGHWRDERWWLENCHRYRHHRDFRGHCEAPRRGGPPRGRPPEYRPPQYPYPHDHGHDHCPPGQARKGNC